MTHLELLLVITIMVLAALVAIPRYANAMSNYRADMAARRIVADLRWAQARARNQSTSQTVTFNTTNSTYQIVGANDPDHIASGYTVDLTADPYRAAITSVSLGTQPQVVFNGYGIPTNGGTIVVGSGGAQKTITIETTAGAITTQ